MRSWGNNIESHVGTTSGLRISHSLVLGVGAGVFQQKSDKNFAGTIINNSNHNN